MQDTGRKRRFLIYAAQANFQGIDADGIQEAEWSCTGGFLFWIDKGFLPLYGSTR